MKKLFFKYRFLIILFVLQMVIAPVRAQVDMSIIVTFDQAPTTATAVKAPLKYNKDFALSMQIDDGHESIFTEAYPVFMGGQYGSQTFPGLTYTDGCGNEINFKMSTAQFSFNGNGENGPDTHVPGSGYGMVSWPQMDTLYKNGWGIINHGVNGDASTDPNFMDYSLKRNKSYTRRKLINTTEGGVLTRAIVNPNGQIPWSQASFDLGYFCALNQDNYSSFMGDHGGNVNSPTVDWKEPQNLFRWHNNNINVTSFVGDLADSSATDGDNYWGIMFTHSIGEEYPFTAFYSDYSIIASNYGTAGADNILMAPDEEIINYLLARDSLSLSSTLAGSSLFISLSGDLPDNMRYYAMTLVINADANITNINVIGADSVNHSPYGTQEGLINVFWDGEVIIPSQVLADSMTTIASNSQLQRDAWVAMDYVITMENNAHKDSLREVLCAIPGTIYDEGFCSCFIDLGPDTTICEGVCDSIYGPVGFDTYQWIVADTVYDTTQNIYVCPTDTTQYVLNAENEFCLATDTIIYNVNPTPVFDLGNDTTICSGESLTIFGPDTTGLNYTFEWIVADTIFDTTQNITVSPSDTTQYILNVENSGGCVGTDSMWVFVLPTPTVRIIPADTSSSCFGDSTVFIAEGTGIDSYLWNTGDTTQSIKVSPEISDTIYKYYVDVANIYTCSTSDTAWLRVNPTPIFDLGNDTTLCFGDSLTIFGPDTTGLNYTFEWIVADTIFDTTQNITVSPADTTHYFLNVENSDGCVGTDSIWIFVLPTPTASIIPTDTSYSCFGDSTVFMVEGIGIESYLWNTGDTTQSIKVSPEVSDTTYKYYIDVTNTYGCSASDTSWLHVNPVPETTMAYDTLRVCNGGEAMLSVFVNQPILVEYFIWHHSGISDTAASVFAFTPSDSVWVYLELITFDTCEVWDSTFVALLDKPVINVSNDQLICPGDTATLSVSGANYYYWTVDQDTISTSSVVEVFPTDTTKYFVEGGFNDGCSTTDSVTVFVLPKPDIEIIFNGTSDTVCQHSTINLAASGGINYWWSTDETTEEIEFVLEQDTLIHLFGSNNYGCLSHDSILLYSKDAALVTMSGLLPAYCENDPASILVGEPEGGLFSGSGIVGKEFRPFVAGNGPHTIKYTFTNTEGCTGIDSASTVVYGSGEQIDLGADQTIGPSETIQLDAGDGFDNYYWSTGSTYRNIIIHYGDNPPGSIIRYVVMGVINGCTSQGETNITFIDPDGIGENSKAKFVIYPNPSNGDFTISYLNEVPEFTIYIYDYFGKLILTKEVECGTGCETTIDLQQLPKGMYIIKTLSQKGVSSGKLLVN